MIRANFNTYGSYVTDSLYQWDQNQDLVITGLNLSVAPEIHFTNANMERAIVRQSEIVGGVVTVRIPNSLLQEALTIKAYVGLYDDEVFRTIEVVEMPVIAKARPFDYMISDSDDEVYSFRALEYKIKTALMPSLYMKDLETLNSTGDPQKIYVLPDGEIYAYESGAWQATGLTIAPKKGVDYFTESDKQELIDKILNEMSASRVTRARISSVKLLANEWIGEGNLYYQVVNIPTVTETSQIDLTPNAEQLAIFHDKDLAFVVENEDGIVTVYAIGQKPENDYIIQVSITEVAI